MIELQTEQLIQRISDLCAERKISRTQALKESGAGKNFINNLKICKPSDHKLLLLANYFNVSVDYLLGNSPLRKPTKHKFDLQLFAEPPSSSDNSVELTNLSEQEKTLVKTFRGTTEEGRMKIIQATMNICDEIENNNRVLLYQAASSEDHRRDRYITKDKKEWTKIEGTPDTDDPLL